MKIQIQLLLKLNTESLLRMYRTFYNSNTTLVKVKFKVFFNCHTINPIQIQLLLKLNFGVNTISL